MARGIVLILLPLALAGCGGGDGESAAPPETTLAAEPAEPPPTTEAATTEVPAPATTEPPPEAPPGLPDELAGYDAWTKLNDTPIPPRDADPHDGTKEVYASVAAGADGLYPDGAIVVKDAVRPGADFVGLVAMMRKERGANAEHNDWVMIEWVREGPAEPFGEIASGGVCTSCHMQARATDYVFTR